MDKWALVINDSWVLDGIHRRATFRLASPRHIENLWNKDGYFVVTAREMLGLVHFGYEWGQVGPWQCFVSKKLVKSQAADLLKYNRAISSKQTIEEAIRLENPASHRRQVMASIRNT
jgi:hypothetical protein